MDVFLLSPLFKEFRKKVNSEMNWVTKLAFYFLPIFFALLAVNGLILTQDFFRVTILAFSIFLGFSLNLFVLIVNSNPEEDSGDYEDVLEALQVLRIFTLFEVFLSLMVVIISLFAYYTGAIASKICFLGISMYQISSFLVYTLIGYFVLVMMKILRDSAIIVSEEYLE